MRPRASACASWSMAPGGSRRAARPARRRRRRPRSRRGGGARACAGPRVTLLERSPQTGNYATAVAIDPLAVSLGEKVELCLATEAAMRTAAVSMTRAGVWAQREHHLFLSTEGDDIEQTVVKCGCDLVTVATRDGLAQQRSNTENHLQGG